MSIFAQIQQAPADIILGLNEAFKADQRSNKVNLGIGVYADEHGKLPVMRAIAQAHNALASTPQAKPYIPIDGTPVYTNGVKQLLFKNTHLIERNQVITVQSLGGTGALKIGADFLFHQIFNQGPAHVVVSNPSWENHKVIFTQAGFTVGEYHYYDAQTKQVDIEGMLASLRQLKPKTVCVFHVCCHNPTGADLTLANWQSVIDVCVTHDLIPFLDMAYQGFSTGVESDAKAVELFANSGLAFFVSSSFSKSFSLYGERVGALSVVVPDANQTPKVLSQVKALIRGNYSNPPTTGAALVGHVLNQPDLYAMWVDELNEMRLRIDSMRQAFTTGLSSIGDFAFILKQRGMFSYSGLTAAQVERLRVEHAIYAIPTGRICVAALNQHNISDVISSISAVL